MRGPARTDGLILGPISVANWTLRAFPGFGRQCALNRVLSVVHAQGDSFMIPIAQEDGGCPNQAALDLFDEATRRAGGSSGEKQAFRVFWRQRIAVANAKGVASAIRHRAPICSGAHWPLQPHHKSQTLIFAPLPAQLAPTCKTREVL